MLFKTEAALRLIQKRIPLLADLTDRESAGNLFESKRTARSTSAAAEVTSSSSSSTSHQHQIWQREFTSWKALRLLIAEHVFHQAIRDMLNTYDPFDDTDAKDKEAPTDKLEREHISLLGVTVRSPRSFKSHLTNKARITFS